MLVLPILVRQPLPGDLQADLDYATHILVVDSSISDYDVGAFRAEAILCLNGSRHLCQHVEQPRPPLLCLPGGLSEDGYGDAAS